jgi:hypothetical protein
MGLLDIKLRKNVRFFFQIYFIWYIIYGNVIWMHQTGQTMKQIAYEERVALNEIII